MGKHWEFHQTSFCSPVALKASLPFWRAFRWVSPFMTSATSVFTYLASRISVAKLLSQSLPKSSSLTWIWNMSSMALNSFKFQTSRWTKWDGLIKPFQFSFWVVNLESSIEKQVCTQDDVVFEVVVVKHWNLWLIDMPVFIKLRQSLVSHRENFLHFKVTCKGPHKFGITKQLCDNTFW